MNPMGVLPLYLSIIVDFSEEKKRSLALNATLVILGLLLLFTLFGNWILAFFKISVSSIRLGGGILLMAIAIEMLGGTPRTKQIEPEEAATVPIASPLIVGPGTIATLILFTTQYPIHLIILASLFSAITVYIFLRYADYIMKLMGKNALRALGRLMAIIIAAVAAEMIHLALQEWFQLSK
jgi:multiple antibiotic resistance protein